MPHRLNQLPTICTSKTRRPTRMMSAAESRMTIMRNSQVSQDQHGPAKGCSSQPLDDVGLPLLDDGQPSLDADEHQRHAEYAGQKEVDVAQFVRLDALLVQADRRRVSPIVLVDGR